MSETENSPSKILAQPLAIGLGAALLLGYAVVTGFAIYEKSHRTVIEHADAGYAVGDKAYFPKSFDATQPLVNYGGHSLYYAGSEQAPDSSMQRVGSDDSDVYAIYKLAGAAGEEASFVYLKVGADYFIKASRQRPGNEVLKFPKFGP